MGRELVAPMLRGKDGTGSRIYCERHRIAQPGRVALAVRLRLAAPPGIEPPNPARKVEDGTGILTR